MYMYASMLRMCMYMCPCAFVCVCLLCRDYGKAKDMKPRGQKDEAGPKPKGKPKERKEEEEEGEWETVAKKSSGQMTKQVLVHLLVCCTVYI